MRGGTVEGGHHLNKTPLQIDAAAGHQVGRGDALRGERIGEFADRDEGGAMETDQSECVADVVVVRVREEHVDIGDSGGLGAERGVLRKQPIDGESHAGDFNLEG
jgi:hypothetical protein